MRRVCISTLLMVMAVLPVGAEEPSGKEPSEVNVLLISLDTLRADHLHCNGYERNTSPNLDKLAEEGVLFEDVTAASSWTIPSHMSVFTSLYPSRHGVEDPTKRIGDGVPTMAGILSEQGYTTAAFVTGPALDHAMGFDRGFGLYDDFSVELRNLIADMEDVSADESSLNHIPTNQAITDLAAKWLEENGNKRFFLFLHYWDCHNDYIPPAPFEGRFDPDYGGTENGRDIVSRREELERDVPLEVKERLMALYDAEIAHTDEHVGKILQILEDMNLSENTLVIVFSDHGEGFWEHGKILHGNGLGEELVHVPLILRLPGTSPAGLRVQGNVSHVDILPTVLGLLGLSNLEAKHGVDLSSVCRGDGEPPDRPVFSELNFAGNAQRAVRWGPYKLIARNAEETADPLLVVRNEKEIEAAEAGLPQEGVQEALSLLTAALEADLSCGESADLSAQSADLEEKTLQRLRALGYGQ